MQELKRATSRRRAGFMAAIVLAGGVAGASLLMPGTALATTGPQSTTTSFTIKPWFTLSPGVAGDEVDVSVTTGTGSAPAPTGSVVVAFGTTTCTVTLITGASDTSTGACFFDGTHAPGIPFGVYTVTATYNPDSSAFSGSSASQSGVVIGNLSKPAWTADTPPLSASPGEHYDYTFQASGVPAPTYSLVGAPSWLQINSTTGEVSGDVPWGIGWFSYSVTASNSVGSISTGTFVVSVVSGGVHHHGHAVITTSLSCPSSVPNFGHGTCTLTVTNQGSASANNVFAVIVLPSQLRARSCTPGGWFWFGGCMIRGNTADLQIGRLGALSSRQLSVTFNVAAPQFFGWWHAKKVTVEGIAGFNHQRRHQNVSFSFATIKIWPSRHWW